ncbi:hypothetical protein MUTS10_16830 [Escherichia coli]|nr:hypothetical protein MUTS9_51680 [Escherichia coli]BDY78351.1 hypothetical protein MUTS10_16830 [Escherichia coli]BDY83375.1 hypothetical protein MUTS11_16910 [Escherichia coli]
MNSAYAVNTPDAMKMHIGRSLLYVLIDFFKIGKNCLPLASSHQYAKAESIFINHFGALSGL